MLRPVTDEKGGNNHQDHDADDQYGFSCHAALVSILVPFATLSVTRRCDNSTPYSAVRYLQSSVLRRYIMIRSVKHMKKLGYWLTEDDARATTAAQS